MPNNNHYLLPREVSKQNMQVTTCMYLCTYKWVYMHMYVWSSPFLADCWRFFLFHLAVLRKREIRDRRGESTRSLHFEICLSKDGFPTETLWLCPPFSLFCVCMCVFVCLSGTESMVLVLPSASGVSLVSYHHPLLLPTYCQRAP